MDYRLNDENTKSKDNFFKVFGSLYKYVKGSRLNILIAFIFLLVNTATTVITPFIIGDVTNKYIPVGDKDGLLNSLFLLGGIYLVGVIASYFQILVMGKVGQAVLFNIRNVIFNKIQSFPLQFFNQNKSGELISRINNDSDRLNQTFSETLLRFTGDILMIVGMGGVMVYLNRDLGLIAWATLAIMLVVTSILSNFIRYRNDQSLQKLSELSGEINESLSNFKVTVVFNRRDYLKDSFAKVNENNRKAATWAGIANSLLVPIYNYAGTIGSLLILVFAIQFLIFDKIAANQMPEIGSLLTFILYSSAFFNPLREMAELFSQIQTGIASWTRIYNIVSLKTNITQINDSETQFENLLMKFNNVSFGYDKENMVLKKINIDIEAGKTYALVGPTGGGKSTTASLMMRLYDASEGQIFFKGKDIKSYSAQELSKYIGFILQEPFLFSGTIAENLKYGNDEITEYSEEQLEKKLSDLGLEKLLTRFSDGLKTVINPGAENISLGQRQLISFVRALLREPELLILDEATANIDTVTEQLLEDILNKLSKKTSKVIIAHRLNTIENADQIFFISGGTIEKPVDFKSALNLINTSSTKS